MFSQDVVLQNSSMLSLDCASNPCISLKIQIPTLLATAIKGCLEASGTIEQRLALRAR